MTEKPDLLDLLWENLALNDRYEGYISDQDRMKNELRLIDDYKTLITGNCYRSRWGCHGRTCDYCYALVTMNHFGSYLMRRASEFHERDEHLIE